MKKLARYIKAARRCEIRYKEVEENELKTIDMFVVSDWAGDGTSRRSTSGGLISWGGGCLNSWSTRQSCIATSSGEA